MTEKSVTDSEAGAQDREIWVDERYASYERFFDHDWARRFLATTQGTRLDLGALDLCTDWKGAASVASMPWLLILTLQEFHKGYMQRSEPFLNVLAKALREHVMAGMGGALSNIKKMQLTRIIDDLNSRVRAEMSRSTRKLSAEPVWRQYLAITEFRLALWSSQRICYGATYHAYENFLRQVAVIGEPQRRDRHEPIATMKKLLAKILGKDLTHELLGEERILVAQLVRNALAHNGGRPSLELRKKRHGLTIEGGVIQIMALDVRQLFDLLKGKALLIAEKIHNG